MRSVCVLWKAVLLLQLCTPEGLKRTREARFPRGVPDAHSHLQQREKCEATVPFSSEAIRAAKAKRKASKITARTLRGMRQDCYQLGDSNMSGKHN